MIPTRLHDTGDHMGSVCVFLGLEIQGEYMLSYGYCLVIYNIIYYSRKITFKLLAYTNLF